MAKTAKDMAALLMADTGAEDADETEAPGEREMIAEELCEALKGKDYSAVADALDAFLSLREQGSEDDLGDD